MVRGRDDPAALTLLGRQGPNNAGAGAAVNTPGPDRPLTRRRLLKGAAAALAVTSARPARAAGETLKILRWMHFVPEFDDWFDRKFAAEWGERNGVRVVVEHVSASDLRARASADVAAGRGHDLVGFLEPPAGFEDHALPLDDVVVECEQRFGKLVPLADRATWNPKARHHFALCESWTPAPLHYRSDWWDEVGVKPDSWELIREGARRIRAKHSAVAGFGLAPELDSNVVLRGLLWSFGAHEQDEAGQVRINSPATVEALKLMTAIFRESMTPDVFTWDPSSNNRLYVYGHGSIIQNPISALRTAERQSSDVARNTRLAPAAAGPRGRLACAHLVHCYVVWKFAEQPELARRFLVDVVGASTDAFRESEFYNLPTFARAVPDLRARLAGDKQGGKTYGVLADAGAWNALPGHPGPPSAAIDEVFSRFVIPRMFARVAKGEQGPEAAARQAEAEMKQIFSRWARTRGG